MATRATQLPRQSSRQTISWAWFREFLRWELASYPGRLSTVIRMTIATTLVMIIIVTFRIPNAGFLAALFSILLARESLAATRRGGRMIVAAFVLAAAYNLLGVMLFRGYPVAHFFWVVGSLCLVFFVIRTFTIYAAAAAFAVPIAVALPVWDNHLPSEIQVENTLWPVLIIAVGVGATVLTEAIYRIFDHSDPLITFVDDLLLAVQQVTESTANGQAPQKRVFDKILQYQMIGTGRLRTTLQRQALDPTRRAQRSALILLADRLIGLAANIGPTARHPSDEEAIRLHALSKNLQAIRTRLLTPESISTSPLTLEGQPSPNFPMLQDMEQVVALMWQVLQHNEAVANSQNAPRQSSWRALFVPDAFHNREYLRFAIAGGLAASICYVLYNALDWPGIFTSVLTCIVTALTTVGSSLQAQFLRLAGFVAGGLILGISAQILILPAIDSISGFTIFFATATAIAAWFATSSPRLSYFGVQMALAFYFVNLQYFQIQTDLTVARDKVIGTAVGILAMGFIFDRYGTKSDADQLPKLLVQNVRMLAELGLCPVVPVKGIGLSQIARLRSQINDNFALLTSEFDNAQFEFHFRNRRVRDVDECQRIQRVQPALRSIYLQELSLLSYRGRPEINSALTPLQNQALDHFLSEYSHELMHIAAWIAHQEDAPGRFSDDSLQRVQQAFGNQNSPDSQAIVGSCQKMVSSLFLLQSKC
jgi:multidrug resistance protein MdtO